MVECILCGERTHQFDLYNKLKNVTSDCKPYPSVTSLHCCEICGHIQKKIDDKFRKHVAQIYKDYEVFKASNGVEQVVFSGSVKGSRSQLLARWLGEKINLNAAHSMLDYGCGDGSALCSFGEVFPEAQLFGYEIEDIKRPKLKSLSNFQKLIVGDKFEPSQRFDFISMIHCLEHLDDPIRVLKNIHNHITNEGYIFIEVPDVKISNYDILIADHISHFSLDLLSEVLTLSGFQIIEASTNVLVKEITILAKKTAFGIGEVNANKYRVREHKSHVNQLISSHIETVAKSKYLLDSHRDLGIFGSSTSAMWLWGELGCQVEVFVDEDQSKYHQNANFKVVSPEMVEDGFTIIIPLALNLATAISAKYSSRNIQYIAV